MDTTVSYTAQGHTQKESNSQWTKDYGYNAAEKLIRYSQTEQGQSGPQIEASYRYDPFGRRIAKTITQGGTTTTTYFVYSEQGLMGEANEQGQLTRAYGFNPIAAQQGLWSADPIWQAEVTNASLTATDTSYHYLHTDHLGTPQLATTKDGSTSWKAAAEAFGAAGIIQSQSTIEMNLRFPGQYFDQETGSHYKFHRDYRPTAGRYVEFDPEGLYGGVNSFTYAGSNAISNGDPQGRFAQVIGPAIIWCARTPACVGGIIGIIIAAPKPPIPAPSTSAGGSDSGSGSGAGEGSDSGGASSTKDGVSEWNKKPPIQRGLYTCRYVMYFPMDLCKKGICPEFVTGRGWAKTLQEAMLMARMEA